MHHVWRHRGQSSSISVCIHPLRLPHTYRREQRLHVRLLAVTTSSSPSLRLVGSRLSLKWRIETWPDQRPPHVRSLSLSSLRAGQVRPLNTLTLAPGRGYTAHRRADWPSQPTSGYPVVVIAETAYGQPVATAINWPSADLTPAARRRVRGVGNPPPWVGGPACDGVQEEGWR